MSKETTLQAEKVSAEPKGLRIVLLIVAAFFLYGVLGGMRICTSVLASSISEWTGMSYGTVSIAYSVVNIVLAISGPFFGLLTLKVPPAKIMVAGAIMGAIGFIGTAFSTTLPALIIFTGIFFGLGASALCYSIVYAATVPVIGLKHSVVFGGILTASMGALGMVLSPVFELGSEAFGVPACLISVGIVSICLVPLCFLFLPKKTDTNSSVPVETENQESPIKTLKSSLTLPFFLMAALGMFALGICDGGMINHLFEYTQMLGSPERMSAVMVSIYSLSYTVGAILGGIVCSQVRNRKCLFGFIFLCWGILNFVGYFLPAEYSAGYLIFSLSGIGMGMSVPTISAIVLEQVSIKKFAAIFSLLFFFIYLAYSLDSILGGLLFDTFHNFLLMDAIAIGLALTVAVVFTISGLVTRRKTENS